MADMQLSIKIGAQIEQAQAALTALKDSFKSLSGVGEKAGDDISKGFDTLGVRSSTAIRAEIEKIKSAFSTLRDADIGFADKERASSALNARLRELNRELGLLHSGARNSAESMQAAGDSGRSLASSLGHAGHVMAELYVAWNALNAAFRVSKDILGAGIGLDRIMAQFQFSTGSADDAAKSLAFIRGEANRLGIDVTAAGEGFAKFAASVRGTSLEGKAARDVFSGVAEAAKVMQLSADETKGIFLALSQMMAKGKVQAEEFRGQLGDRLPIATTVAAKALGVTTAEFSRMLDAGELLAEDFLPKFAKALRENVADALPTAVNTLDAQLNRLKNAWTLAMQEVAKSGAMDEVAKVVTELAGKIRELSESGELKRFGAEFANALKNAGEAIIALTGFVSEHANTIKELIGLYLTLRGLSFAGKAIGAIGGFAEVAAGAKAATAEVGGLAGALKAVPLRVVPVISLAILNFEIWSKVFQDIHDLANAGQIAINLELKTKGDADLKAATEQLAMTKDYAATVGESFNATRAAISATIRAFREGVSAELKTGKGEAEATAATIKEVFNGKNLFDSEKLREIAEKFSVIKSAGLSTSLDIQKGWSTALEKMGSQDLRAFQDRVNEAFLSSKVGAESLKLALTASLSAAFDKLGGELEKVRTGIDKATKEAIGFFNAIAENAQSSGKEVGEAFNLALKTADTRQEVALLESALKQAAAEGKIAGKDLEDVMSRLGAKTTEVGHQMEGALGDTFKRVGIKSREELQAIAAQARKDFMDVATSGKATSEGIAAAEKKWKDAQQAAEGTKRAAGGIAEETAAAADNTEKLADAALLAVGYSQKMASAAMNYANTIRDWNAGSKKILIEAGMSAEEAPRHLMAFQTQYNQISGPRSMSEGAAEYFKFAVKYAKEVNLAVEGAVAWTKRLTAAAADVRAAYDRASRAAENLARGLRGAGDAAGSMGVALVGDSKFAEAMRQRFAAAEALARAWDEVRDSARQAGQSAISAAQGLVGSARSIHEELLMAQGKEEEAARSRMEARKAELKIQYAQLQVQIQIAMAQAKMAGVDATDLQRALGEASAAYGQAMKDLDALYALEKGKRAQAHQEELARIAAEKAARLDAERQAERAAREAIGGEANPGSTSRARELAKLSLDIQGGNTSNTTNNNTINITGLTGTPEEIARQLIPEINRIQRRSR